MTFALRFLHIPQLVRVISSSFPFRSPQPWLSRGLLKYPLCFSSLHVHMGGCEIT